MAVPADMPVTRPVEVTVATDGLLLLHVPPGVASVNSVDVPTQVDVLPEIGKMEPLVAVTVKARIAEQPPTV